MSTSVNKKINEPIEIHPLHFFENKKEFVSFFYKKNPNELA
jgi:hypothetical protein